MLSIKDIQEVSFRKSNFSGYNSDDVDQFIDEVLETVTALAKENAEAKTRTTDNGSRVSELAAKNAELQEKLSTRTESRMRSSAPSVSATLRCARPRPRRRRSYPTRTRGRRRS